jgi:hypothetical protein
VDIQLDTRIVLQLEELARQQDREIIDILRDAIAQYVREHTGEDHFRNRVRALVQEHRWLLQELDAR